MNKTIIIIFFIAITLLSTLNLSSCNRDDSKEEINIDTLIVNNNSLVDNSILLTADAWLPFNGVSGSGPEGYMIEIARNIFEENGIQINYINVPWPRAISGTMEGMFNGAVGASRGDGEDLIFPQEELGRGYLAFYIYKDTNWKFTGEKSLFDKSLAVINSYDYRPWLGKYIKENSDNSEKIQIMSGETPLDQNIRKLISGRVDVVVGNESSIRYAAQKMGVLDDIKSAGYDDKVAYLYIGFSPADENSPYYADLLSEGIIKMRTDGSLDGILNRYGLFDWK